MNEIRHTEYAVEVYDKNDHFVRQIIVFDLYTKAEEFMNICDEELLEGEYLGILAIFYDKNGNEIGTGRL